MPESKRRVKAKSRMPAESEKDTGPQTSPVWLVPLMLTFFGIGLAWVVVYYLAPSAPFIASLGGWNMAIGFGFIMVGFVLATRWR